MDSLEELVEQSDRLLMEIQGDTDLPLITRSLEQMGAYGEKLCSSRGARSDVKAARLLGPTINYDLPNNLSAKLESLSQIKEAEFAKPKIDMDIHAFLRCERENVLFTATEQAKRAVSYCCLNTAFIYVLGDMLMESIFVPGLFVNFIV